jgi:hypothetical protein
LVVQLLGTISVSLAQTSDKWPPQRVDSLSNEDWFAAFKRAKASQKDFKVKSIDEFKGLTKLYLSLVNDGQVVNRFHLKTGALIHCVVVSTQRSLAENNAVANPLPSPPSVNPGNSAAPSVQAVAESFGMDGSLDDGGNIRSCPDGSFPKLIPKPEDLYRFSTLREFFRKHPEFETPEGAGAGHEWAGALKSVSNWGSSAIFNVWSPSVEQSSEFSLSQLWVSRGTGTQLQTAEAGWQRYSQLYGDNNPHLFIYFTTNGYSSEGSKVGCYNISCTGFIQTNNSVIIGGALAPVSTAGGQQYEATIAFIRDTASPSNWWLSYNNTWVGYYPSTLYASTGLANISDTVNFGGEIVNQASNGLHTTTQMGGGHFPSEGLGQAAFTRNLRYVDVNNTYQDASGLQRYVRDSTGNSVASYYDLIMNPSSQTGWGQWFLFGGPGRTCSIVIGDLSSAQASFGDAFSRNKGSSYVGCPINSVHRWFNGQIQDFNGGSGGKGALMKPDGSSFVAWIHGAIWNYYEQHGGPDDTFWDGSKLGYPTDDEQRGQNSSISGSETSYSTCQNGTICFYGTGARAGQAYIVRGAMLTQWSHACSPQCYEGGPLGMPIGEETAAPTSPFGTTGRYQDFESGQIYWHASGPRQNQTFYVQHGIAAKYKTLGSGSALGFPISNEYVSGGVPRNDFEGGYIYWDGSQAIVVLNGSCNSPGTFSLSAPTNGQSLSSTTSITLTWGSSANANSYDVYFGTSSNPPFLANQTGTSRTVTVTPGQTYFWKVVAKVNCGSATTTAGVWSFTVQQTCNSPGTFSLSSPSNGQSVSSTTSVTLTWGSSANANSYDVYFGTSSNPPFLANQTGTSRTVTVTPGETYFWKIVAKVNCGSATATAGVWSFTVQQTCNSPGTFSLTAPSNGQSLASTTTSVTLTWGSSANANSYDVYFGTSSNPPFVGNQTGTSRTVTVASGQTYFWKVVAKVNCGSATTTAGVSSFSVQQSGCVYTLSSTDNTVGPGTGVTNFFMDTTSGCTWTAVSDSPSWLTTSSSGSGDGTITYNYIANNSTTSRTGHITAGGKVHTVTQIGLGGAGSVRFSASSYSVNESDGTVTITVTRSSGIDTGTVQYSTSNGSASAGSDYTVTSGLLLFGSNQTSKTFTVPILEDTAIEGNESFNVTLTNPSLSLTLGTPTTATVTIVDNDTLTTPIANPASALTSNSFIANWTSSSSATGYRLDVSTDSSFSNFVSGYQNLDIGNTLSRNVTGLTASTLYHYRVRAYNGTLTSTNSNTINVSTSGPMIFIEQGTTNRAAAIDSVTWLRGPFRITDLFNFSSDRHTRVILFTSDLGLTQPDTSQLAVRAGGVALTIESVGPILGVPGMGASYIVVRLPDGLPTGDLPLTVTLRGSDSVNSPVLEILP